MANIKSKYKIYNGTGWDVYHFETVASQVGTVAKGGTGYDESNQFVKGSQKDKLDLGTNTAGAFATLDNSAKVPSNQIPILDESKLPSTYSKIEIEDGGNVSFQGDGGVYGNVIAPVTGYRWTSYITRPDIPRPKSSGPIPEIGGVCSISDPFYYVDAVEEIKGDGTPGWKQTVYECKNTEIASNKIPFGIEFNDGDISFIANDVGYDGPPKNQYSLTNKEYVDMVAGYGLNILEEVRLVATSQTLLTGTPEIDGVQTVAGDRVLVINEMGHTKDGVYIVKSSGLWDRAEDASSSSQLTGAMVSVTQGTNGKGKIYWQSKTVNVVDEDVQDWIVFTSVGQFYQAGTGLGLSGSTFSIKNGGVGTNQLASDAVTNPKVSTNADIATSKIKTGVLNEAVTVTKDATARTLDIMVNEILTTLKSIKGTTNWHTVQSSNVKDLNIEVGKKQNKITVGETEPAKVNGDIWIDTN